MSRGKSPLIIEDLDVYPQLHRPTGAPTLNSEEPLHVRQSPIMTTGYSIARRIQRRTALPELTWIGKLKVIRHDQDVPFHLLETPRDQPTPPGGDSERENLVIQGDNLVALKALLPEYQGRITAIYIDPPYNTGKEGWVYNDAVNDPQIRRWLGQVVGPEDADLTRHDKWLCMMYPRLRLLWRLLADDGVIFISIDDNEVSSLRAMCQEIFGASNELTTFVWETSGNKDNQDAITHVHEYVLAFCKKKSRFAPARVVDPNVSADSKIRRNFAQNSVVKNGPKNPASEVTLPAGFPCLEEALDIPAHERFNELVTAVADNSGWVSRDMKARYDVAFPARRDDMVVDNGVLIKPCRVYTGWANVNKLRQFIANGCQPLVNGKEIVQFHLTKTGVVEYRKEGRTSHYVQTVLRNFTSTEVQKNSLENMGLNFDYPKPVDLVQYLLSVADRDDAIVLDSFAGSGTVGEAVLRMNAVDGKDRQFILVELGDYARTTTAQRVANVAVGYKHGKNSAAGIGGSFTYKELGEPLLVDGGLNPKAPHKSVRQYIWFTETGKPYPSEQPSHEHFLGRHEGVGYFFYYSPDDSTVLELDFLRSITEDEQADEYIIYADACTLSPDQRRKYRVTFRKIPRDITNL